MARSYTTTIKLNVWKEHTCVCCSGSFTYNLVRKIKGTGRTADKAQQLARKKFEKALVSDTNLEPCPSCGLYQPEMIGQRRARLARIIAWSSLVLLATTMILLGTDAIQSDLATWVTVVIGLLSVALLAKQEFSNPNGNPSRNLSLAQQKLAAGELRAEPVPFAGSTDPFSRLPGSGLNRITLLVMLVGVAAMDGAEAMRSARKWPLNPMLYPAVVGPGDTSKFYLTQQIHSVDHHWVGSASVTLFQDADSSGKTTSLRAQTNQNNWPSTMNVKPEEKDTASNPWVKMTMPADASLAGNTVRAHVLLDLEYPEISGPTSFSTQRKTLEEETRIQLASPNAGALYSSLWWTGTGMGLAAVVFGSAIIAGSGAALRKRGNPAKVYPVATPVA